MQIYGFSKCGFVAFTVPSHIEVLDHCAFAECYSLGCLEFAPGSRLRIIKGFGKTRIGTLKLPETIEIVRPDAFCECAELSTVIITGPNALTSFCGFKRCIKLLSVVIGKQEWIANGVWDFSVCPFLQEIDGFDECCVRSIGFPDDIEIIKGFRQCRHLVKVEFPRSGKLKVVDGFNETAIKKLAFPSSLETIAGFENCQLLETVEFAADGCLKKINGFQYADCLTEVIIPKSVQFLGWESFSNCDQLSKVLLPLDGNLCELSGFSAIPITSIIIPDSVEFLVGLCGCSTLKDVKFGPGSKLREVRGLSGCGFMEIDLPDSVEIVGPQAFQSEEFKILKVGEKSRLKIIRREFHQRPLRFFLITPEPRLSRARQFINVKLSHQCPQLTPNQFTMVVGHGFLQLHSG
jgi:hypothetical protein